MINFFGSACSWSSSCFQHRNGLHFKAPGPHPRQLHAAPQGAVGFWEGWGVSMELQFLCLQFLELPSWELHPKTGTCGAHPPHRSCAEGWGAASCWGPEGEQQPKAVCWAASVPTPLHTVSAVDKRAGAAEYYLRFVAPVS